MGVSVVRTQVWFSILIQRMINKPLELLKNKLLLEPSSNRKDIHPLYSNLKLGGIYLVRRRFRKLGIPREMRKIMREVWRDGTKKQYSIYVKKWLTLYLKKKGDPNEFKVIHSLQVLMLLFKNGYGFYAINSAWSVLSCIFNGPQIGDHSSV